jgi:hypothetical protein
LEALPDERAQALLPGAAALLDEEPLPDA